MKLLESIVVSGTRNALILFILLGSMITTGCPKKTTLDRIGGLTIAGINSYILQLDALREDGVLTSAKQQELKDQALAIRKRAIDFRNKIASYNEIQPGDVNAIVTIAGDLIGLFDASLKDEALVKLPSDATALKILRGLRIGVNQARIAVAALFPEPTPTDPTVANRSIRLEPRAIAPSKVVVNLN